MSDLELHLPARPVRRDGQKWAACGEGKCQCGQIWDIEGDSPILKVLREHEEEGVTYPAELVERNALLAEAAPELLAMLKRVAKGLRDAEEGVFYEERTSGREEFEPSPLVLTAEALIKRVKGT